MIGSTAPRIREYPEVLIDSGFTYQGLEVVPLEVMRGWIVRSYGEDELPRLTGLPASVLAALYPEVMPDGVAEFQLIRKSPAMAQVQELLDAVSKAMQVVDGEFQGSQLFRDSLKRMRGWSAPGSQFYLTRSITEREWSWRTPGAHDLCQNLMWAATETISKSSRNDADESVWDSHWWAEIYELCLLVCVYHVGSPSMCEAYAGFGVELADAFAPLDVPGCEELARVMGEGRR